VSAADWWQQAACRDADPDLFAYDPTSDPPETAQAAKQVCAGCPVTDHCLAFASQTMRASQDHTGIYGGLTPAERAERRPPEQPHPWRRRDPEFAARSFATARELGVRGAARFYQVDPKTLRAAWDRHGLGRRQRRPPSQPPAAKLDRQTAQQAFAFARAHSIAAAARRFGVTRRGLRAAWDRHDLGHPHQGIPLGELRARWNREHWWRRDERVRRLQAAAQARQRRQLGQLPLGRPPSRPEVGRAPQPSGRRPREPRAGREEERER
jgi:WhiB family transcriptional regulator, redox-sensing transcriptional regulator